MSGIALNSGHALLRGWVTPGYPVVYTAVHRNPDGVPQSWQSPSLQIGAGPQSSIAAATYTGADVALSDLVEGSVTYANARATWTLTAAATTSWAADPSVWITDAGWLVAGGSISTRSVYRGAEVQCLLDGVVYVTVNPVTAATIAAALGYTPADAAAIGNADNLLTGTVADARLPVTAQAATLAATFGGLPAAYIDPRTMADGAVTTLSRGTLSASYGNSPAAISSGRIVHTPLTGANSAAYVEANLGGPARRIGAVVEWPAATGTLALVLPSASWAGGIGNAGIHATITAAGTVSSGRYISPGGLVGTQTAAVGALTGRHTFEVGVDTRLQQITVWLDGKRILKYTDAAAFANLSTYAIWELFEPNGTSDTPVIIHSSWADVEQVIPPSPIGTDITPQAPTTSAIVATTGTYPITTSIASIGMGSVTATYPSSGKILARYSCWVDATAATGVVFGSQNAIGAQKIAGAGFVGRVTCETIMVGTPGASVTITPRMWTSAGTASVTVGGSAGNATISAIDLR